MTARDADGPSTGAVGKFIRRQREMAKLSVRQLARMSNVSNAYLSQIERGLHEPSIRVIRAVSEALSVPMDDLMKGRGPSSSEADASTSSVSAPDLTAAIQAEPNLTEAQKAALLAVYRGFLEQGDGSTS